MEKIDAVDIIHRAAKQYDELLNKKSFLIVYGAPNAPQSVEVMFPEKNFLHLTGISLNGNHLLRDVEDKTSNLNLVFYHKAKNFRLSPDDFEFRSDGTTEQKLEVLCSAINIMKNAKMIGDYNHSRLRLQSEKITGGIYSCIGLVQAGRYYVPNTVLSTDTRKEIQQPQRVLTILSKNFGEPYSEIQYVAKKIDIAKLLQKVSKTQTIDSSLIPSATEPENNSATQSTNIVQFQKKTLPRSDVLTRSDDLPTASLPDRIKGFFAGIADKINGAIQSIMRASTHQQRPTQHRKATSKPKAASQQHKKAQAQPDPDKQPEHEPSQKTAEPSAQFSFSRARLAQHKANAQHAGNTEKPSQRTNQQHSHDDDILS